MSRSNPNLVRVVGTIDIQTFPRHSLDRRERPPTTLLRRFNEVQGSVTYVLLQVCSPFGKPFQITLHLEGQATGCELLEQTAPGTLLAVEGELEWVQTTDPRYTAATAEHGRRASELIVRAHAIDLATPEDKPGCDVWLEGNVLTTSRLLRHPDRPIMIAVTTVRVNVERTRRGSRVRLNEPANVAVAIPIEHPEAPYLMRPGNRVVIEGMLERYVVPLHGAEVEQAVAALDTTWLNERLLLSDPQELQKAERRYLRQRRRLQETVRTRVVAGYVELITGTPASLEEAQQLRAASQRRRRADQAQRRQSGIGFDPPS